MDKLVVGFLLAVLAVMLIVRTASHRDQVIPLSDEKDTWRHWNFVQLPPSGYKPGHLLHDTLKNDMLQQPPYTEIGRYAYREFLSSPKAERERVMAELRELIRPLDTWLAELDRADIDFLCIGESHQENYRRFLGDRFFSAYRLDMLFLEARELPARLMDLRAESGEWEVELLDADIARIIRAARARNPEIFIAGIEESRAQKRARKGSGEGSRDDSIVRNVLDHLRPGRRSAALLGALHCTQDRNWLYAQLKRNGSQLGAAKLRSLRVVSRRKDLLTRELVRFLRALGLQYSEYVVTDTAELPAAIHDWFLDLSRNLTRYETVIVFDG